MAHQRAHKRHARLAVNVRNKPRAPVSCGAHITTRARRSIRSRATNLYRLVNKWNTRDSSSVSLACVRHVQSEREATGRRCALCRRRTSLAVPGRIGGQVPAFYGPCHKAARAAVSLSPLVRPATNLPPNRCTIKAVRARSPVTRSPADVI